MAEQSGITNDDMGEANAVGTQAGGVTGEAPVARRQPGSLPYPDLPAGT